MKDLACEECSYATILGYPGSTKEYKLTPYFNFFSPSEHLNGILQKIS